jgi:membrane protease YdiL (CAAX protease family)
VTDKSRLSRVLAVWIAVIAAIRLISWAASSIRWIAGVSGALTAIVLIYPPVIAGFASKRDLSYWRFDRAAVGSGLKWFLIAASAVFPAAFAVNHFYQKIAFGAGYAAHSSDLWGPYVLSQVLLVGFPEEFFFRGYLQGEFSRSVPSLARIFGVPFGLPQLAVSGLFALSHSLITFQWWHALIFFPSLVFAWLKEKTGTIWAGSLFHAACNVFAYWVALHYRT